MGSDTESRLLEYYLPKLVRGAGVVFIGVILGRVAGYLARVIIARGLGPESYGLILLAIAAVSIVSILTMLGLGPGVTRHVSFYKGRDDQEGIKGTITSAIKIILPFRITAAVLLFFLAGWISVYLFHEPKLTNVLKVMSFLLLSSVFLEPLLSAMTGFQRMDYLILSRNITQYFARVAFIALFLFLGYGLLGAALGYVIAPVPASLLAFYLLQRRIFPIVGNRVQSLPQAKKLFAYSLPLMLAGITFLVTGWTDTLMLGFFRTAADVGFYNAARPTVQLMSAISGGFVMIFFPILSELYGKGRKKEMEEVFKSISKWIFMVLLPVALLIIVFSGVILKILFGPAYQVASLTLSILAVGFLLFYLFMASRRVLETIGRTKLVFFVSLTMALLNIGLNYLFIPPYGIEGAAIATGLSVAIGGILFGVTTDHATGFKPLDLNSAKIFLAGLISGVPLFLLSKFVVSSSILAILGLVVIFFFLYFLLLIALRSFDRNDLVVLNAVERGLGADLSLFKRAARKLMGVSG